MKVAGGKDETCLQREPHPTSSSQLIVSVTSKIVRGSTKYHFEFIQQLSLLAKIISATMASLTTAENKLLENLR